jgi:hypothetical protein
MRGRHEGPEPRTDAFMAVVVLALLTLLAVVTTLALLNR